LWCSALASEVLRSSENASGLCTPTTRTQVICELILFSFPSGGHDGGGTTTEGNMQAREEMHTVSQIIEPQRPRVGGRKIEYLCCFCR
jgi:hypothetical protein